MRYLFLTLDGVTLFLCIINVKIHVNVCVAVKNNNPCCAVLSLFVHFLFIFDLLFASFKIALVAIYWERGVVLCLKFVFLSPLVSWPECNIRLYLSFSSSLCLHLRSWYQ